jgi:hypothetical protein
MLGWKLSSEAQIEANISVSDFVATGTGPVTITLASRLFLIDGWMDGYLFA